MMKLSKAAEILQTPLQGEDVSFNSVSTDTRTLKKGDLFIALKGPNFDGNHFIQKAEEKAAAAIVSQSVNCQIPFLQVSDTRIALGKLAAFYRQQFQIPLIGITGSCGKTTTKTMTACILQQSANTLATEGTLNNDIGVPLTLLRLKENYRYAVIEMGTNHFGEIDYVAKIARPTIAMITNAAPVHLEFLNSVQEVAKEKGSIFNSLTEDGVAIINADDKYANYWQELVKDKKKIYFGRNHSAEFLAKDVKIDNKGYPAFILITPQGEMSVQLRIIGEHNVMNALAASAAAMTAGASLSDIKKGLEIFEPINKRLVIRKGYNGALIIDDSYNANPLSVRAAMQILANQTGRKIFVFADMRELGKEAKIYHEQVGVEAKQLGIDDLFTYGELSAVATKAFGSSNHFTDQHQLINAVHSCLNSGVIILVKGSRSMQMEKVVAALLTEG